MRNCAFELVAYALDGRAAFLTLLLGPLATCDRVSLSFLGNSDFRSQRLRAFALFTDETSKFSATSLGGSASSVCGIASCFCGCDTFFRLGNLVAKLGNSGLETRELFLPRIHLASRTCDLDREPASRDLYVLLGAATLTRK
jgi:hypothetical protein